MQKAFALNLSCLCRYVNDKPPTALVSFSRNMVVFILYFKFTGADLKLHLCGQRSLVLLIYGAVFDFSM